MHKVGGGWPRRVRRWLDGLTRKDRIGVRPLAPALAAPLLALALALAAGLPTESAAGSVAAESTAASSAPVIAAAGDIACSPSDPDFNGGKGTATRCHMKATSDLMVGRGLAAVLPLGDEQYVSGTLAEFRGSYDASWGRLNGIARPVPGNHEYLTAGAKGYFSYFGAAGGNPGRGYYSYDIGAWHLVALNANCPKVGGCGAGSPQETWLRSDLAAHPASCTLAYWHQPRFSSAQASDVGATAALWRALYAARAEIILNGHKHTYERFAPQTPAGALNRSRGIREFVVGTGGEELEGFVGVRPNSEVRSSTFGVLLLTLRPAAYDWRFVPEAGASFTDSGTERCH